METLDLLRLMANKGASDLFVTVGAPPSLKVDGQVLPIKTDTLNSDGAKQLCYSLMDEHQRARFESDKDANFAVNPDGLGRFRVNVFQQQGEVGMVIRRISSHIPTFKELNLPAPIFEKIAMMRRGLIFFCRRHRYWKKLNAGSGSGISKPPYPRAYRHGRRSH